MERRQNALCDVKMCRFCLSRDDTLKSLYDRDRTRTQKNVVPLPLKILSSLAVEVFPSDHLPMFICERCRFFMDICYEFKQICREADELTYQYIQTGSNMKGINWPTSLIKIFNKCTSKTVLKTVVEGGTTVQVTHGVSDSEDEIDSVYNVKYDVDDDGKEISATLCQEKDDSNDIDSMHIKRGYKSWPCDECDCNYPLKQLLKLHKMQKHKDKDVHCDIDPDAKYFSKGKLTSHGQSNLEEYPYQCTICGKGYQRLSLLKRHEKSVHADLPQLACAQCPSTFLSMEQLKAHQIRHGSSAIRPLPCDQCGRRFVDKWALHVHKKNAHTQQPGFCCEYCPEKFNSITKLTRHVRTHAGTRSYPCKYCDKNFVKSHHYTRHLRMKHPWETRGDRNPNTKAVPTNEGYRCDQCDATLATQDDLIYHSAIHATQNLTCPLCQEKFRNVDEVTSHIKSHCSGNEYMCNYCELIFTTQEKLDTHTMTVHEDEIEHIHDESSMEVEDLEDDDCSIQVKEEGNEMVVEIKKPNDYLIQPERNENIFEFDDNRTENTNSEESENENETYEEQPNLSNVIHIEDRQGRIHYVMPSQKIVEHPKDIIIKAKEPKPVVQQKDPITLQKEAIAQKELVVQSNVVVQQKDATLQRIEPVVQQAQAVTQQTEAVVQQTDVFLQPKQEPERSEDTELPETSTDTDVQKSNKDDGSEVDSTPLILRKAEMVRRKLQAAGVNTSTIQSSEKKEKPKPEGNSAGASDKSLRLLEKELQELKRTNPRQEVKTPVKTELRRKPQLHTSTPKPSRISEDKKNQASKSPAVEKKPVLRAAVKENKEPKEKETKPSVKEEKEKEQLKTVVKNGANDKDVPEEGVRRSTRPSKIKDYAKMIRTQDSDDDNSEMDEEEYVEEKTPEVKSKPRRGSVKAPKTAQLTPAKPMPCIVTRKRGRPRKDGGVTETPAKQVKKNDDNEESEEDNDEAEFTGKNLDNCKNYMKDTEESKTEDAKSAPIVSPSGQTLKKVPIKALPPGVKPMPLPSNARPMGPGEVTEMQIGKKMVKVQKIVMTKAEVEAMAKKGLVEMKGGTMVLKQGIKLPSADAITLKSSVGSQGEKSQTTPAPSVSTDEN